MLRSFWMQACSFSSFLPFFHSLNTVPAGAAKRLSVLFPSVLGRLQINPQEATRQPARSCSSWNPALHVKMLFQNAKVTLPQRTDIWIKTCGKCSLRKEQMKKVKGKKPGKKPQFQSSGVGHTPLH